MARYCKTCGHRIFRFMGKDLHYIRIKIRSKWKRNLSVKCQGTRFDPIARKVIPCPCEVATN